MFDQLDYLLTSFVTFLFHCVSNSKLITLFSCLGSASPLSRRLSYYSKFSFACQLLFEILFWKFFSGTCSFPVVVDSYYITTFCSACQLLFGILFWKFSLRTYCIPLCSDLYYNTTFRSACQPLFKILFRFSFRGNTLSLCRGQLILYYYLILLLSTPFCNFF